MVDDTNIYSISNTQSMGLESEFVESCLPLTMKFADKHKSKINKIPDFPTNSYPFHDKVLVWIFPSFKEDVEKYHSAQGKEIEQLINPQALKSIDELAVQKLKERILLPLKD
jgi:hypothetical protein